MDWTAHLDCAMVKNPIGTKALLMFPDNKTGAL